MSCSPSLARKKRNLHPNHRGLRHALCSELGCSPGTNLGSTTSLSGTRSAGQAVHSNAFPFYDTLYYGAPYEIRTDKQQTYSVEAVNADLRHYLKRLARRSRCFTRRMQSLANNLQLFV